VVQFASSDFGHTAVVVETFRGLYETGAGYPDVVAVDSGFVWAWLDLEDATDEPSVLGSKTGAADQKLTTGVQLEIALGTSGGANNYAWATYTGAVGATAEFDEGDLALATDERDTVHALFHAFDVAATATIAIGESVVARSFDQGDTWPAVILFAFSGWSYTTEVTGGRPADYGATWHRGRIMVCGGFVENTASAVTYGPSSLCVYYLGGWSTVTLPTVQRSTRELLRSNLRYTCNPTEDPRNANWAFVAGGGGGGTQNRTDGWINLVTAAADTYYLERNNATGPGLLMGGAVAAGDNPFG
jgi:hypothetical protein